MRPTHPPRILVIDDDERITRILVKRLQNAGYDCLSAATGDEGLHRYSMAGIDLIITDLHMPGIDGIGMINLIRAASSVPIIVISGHPDAYRRAMGSLHDITLMAKPFNHSTLLRRVESELALSGVPILPSSFESISHRN
ncbi:response regulator [Planctomycetales bacterium ZRK34]|nr:response regulator [Planctomycetales bacterium ZRK34]